jgi:NTP pyrophosphatase (non-canonical NTP hydrolase)
MSRSLSEQFEAASAACAEANDLERDPDGFVLKEHKEIGELTQVWNKLTGRGGRRGLSEEELRVALADETADLLGRVLLFPHRNQIDLTDAINRKRRFRPGE